MVDEDNFFEELKSGLVLCKVVERPCLSLCIMSQRS